MARPETFPRHKRLTQVVKGRGHVMAETSKRLPSAGRQEVLVKRMYPTAYARRAFEMENCLLGMAGLPQLDFHSGYDLNLEQRVRLRVLWEHSSAVALTKMPHFLLTNFMIHK